MFDPGQVLTDRTRIGRFFASFLILFSMTVLASGQTNENEKQITHYNQTWVSINSTMRFSDHWGMMADFHDRTQGFFKEDYFYLARLGVVNWINGKYPVAYGIAHLWLAPEPGNKTWSNENRIYQQWSAAHGEGIVTVLQRIRTEQRWKDVIVDDQRTGEKSFSFRVRYLASFDARIFNDPKLPKLILSDEILVQFGKDIVMNAFDQNRLFIGLKVPVTHDLIVDFGYMNVFQQKSTGYKYDANNVFRVFFYFTPDFRKKGKVDTISSDDPE
jgi:hypothetical protein